MDYDQIIAQALQGVNPLIAQPVPPLNTGTPLLPQNMASDAVNRAMVPGGAPVTADDKSTTMAKIGMALMQPRMPGQSVAGNIGGALNQGSDYLDAAKARAQTTASQQAGTALQATQVGAATQLANAQLQSLAVKFPMEVAELQQKLKDLTLAGKTNEYNAIMATLKAQPDYLMATIKADLEGKQAAVGLAQGHTRMWNSYADYLDRGGKDKGASGAKTILHSSKNEDGSLTSSYMIGDKGPFYEIVRPGISDMNQAMKIAEKELKKEGEYGWFGGPTPKEIKERAQKLMTPSVITIDSDGNPVKKEGAKPGTPESAGEPEEQSTGPTSVMPTESAGERRDAAGRSLKVIEGEMQAETDPEKKANLQREYDKVKLEATSENPHQVGKAKNPASVAKAKKETWTKDRVDELLGAKGVNTPGDKSGTELDQEDAQKEYDAALAELKAFAKKPSRDPKAVAALKQKLLAARAKLTEAMGSNSKGDPITGDVGE